jgi:hypothetical protein
MDIPELVAEHEMAFKPQREAEEQPKEYEEEQLEKDEECITLRHSDLLHFQDTLVDIRSQIRDVRFHFADLHRDVRQDRLEVQEMFRAIMDRLPPAAGPHAPPPAPCTLFFIFYISTLWTVQILSLGVFLSLCAHFVFNLCILC